MKKITLLVLMIFAAVTFSFAQQKMPADVKIVADKITKISSDYYRALAKVKSAKEMAAVINKYAAELEKIAPQVKRIEEKYGSMEDDSDDDEDLSEDLVEFEMFMAEQMNNSDIGAGFENLAKYYTDPAVQKALERLAKVSESMGMSDDDDDDSDSDDYSDDETDSNEEYEED
jgi:Skp family chaperone for outer membrane proteins